MENYRTLRERQQKEFNQFPLKAAFSDEQFKKAMEEWGLTEKDTDKVISIGYGCFIRKEDADAFHELTSRHSKEMKECMKDEDFMVSAFKYELGNHEYCITYDYDDTLYALGLTEDDILNNEMYQRALYKAEKQYLANIE